MHQSNFAIQNAEHDPVGQVMSADNEILRVAMAALTLEAGGSLTCKLRDYQTMPDGQLLMEFDDDSLLFRYDRTLRAEHLGIVSGDTVEGIELTNTAMIRLGLSIVTINAGGEFTLKPSALDKVMSFEGYLTMGATDDGGFRFDMIRGFIDG